MPACVCGHRKLCTTTAAHAHHDVSTRWKAERGRGIVTSVRTLSDMAVWPYFGEDILSGVFQSANEKLDYRTLTQRQAHIPRGGCFVFLAGVLFSLPFNR